jgi:hypothetical protein
MIDYEKIVSIIIRKTGRSRNEAWEGLNEAYLYVDRTRSEAEIAAYLIEYGAKKCIKDHYVTVNKIMVKTPAIVDVDDEPENRWVDFGDALPAEEDDQEDNDFILETLEPVPKDFKIPVAVVVKALLTNGKRRPITVEAVRQLLKTNNIGNTSENARQVYTYLTTHWRKH